jgi:hypothetical protein
MPLQTVFYNILFIPFGFLVWGPKARKLSYIELTISNMDLYIREYSL